MAFTEQGVAMLSSVLHSDRAIDVNIAIMRTFVKLRQMLDTHSKLAQKLAELESKYDDQFQVVFEALNELMKPEDPPRKQIGFSVREARAKYGTLRHDGIGYTAIYEPFDGRTNVPGITKKDRPLTAEHFAEFEKCYGADPNGLAKRKESERVHKFSIAEIKAKDFKLDGFKWLKDDDIEDSDDLPEPEELATDAIAALESAVEELNAVLAALREQAGLSQKELALRLHTSQQQISRMESPAYEGHSLSMLRRVARELKAQVKVTIEPLPTEQHAMVAETRAKDGKR